MATTLELILLYLVAAVMGVVVCRLLRLPPMLGYLAVGVLIGPHALALARDTAYLRDYGYTLEKIRAFDLFPMTHHIECVARFVADKVS